MPARSVVSPKLTVNVGARGGGARAGRHGPSVAGEDLSVPRRFDGQDGSGEAVSTPPAEASFRAVAGATYGADEVARLDDGLGWRRWLFLRTRTGWLTQAGRRLARGRLLLRGCRSPRGRLRWARADGWWLARRGSGAPPGGGGRG